MSKSNNKFSNIGIIIIILSILAIGLIIPIVLEFCFFRNDIYSAIHNADWASFLGSYIGGYVGGIGTLLAVYITTKQSSKIQQDSNQRHDADIKNAHNEIIRENAVVIYYDLKFAFEDFSKLAKVILFDTSNMIQTFKSNCKLISNTYLDSNWIHTVSKISSEFEEYQIRLLYDLYGTLNTLLKSIF